jgi:hypothetical protein
MVGSSALGGICFGSIVFMELVNPKGRKKAITSFKKSERKAVAWIQAHVCC